MNILNPNYLVLDYAKLQKAEQTKDKIVKLALNSGEDYQRFTGYKELKQTTMAYKSAKQEATNNKEFEVYYQNLQNGLEYVMSHIGEENAVDYFDHKHFLGLNSILTPETYFKHSGRYRQTDVIIGSDAPPAHTELDGCMNEFIFHLNEIENPVLKAAYCHFETVRIHPFADGNGRTARLMANWILMNNLFTPTYTELNKVQNYTQMIRNATGELYQNDDFPGKHTNRLFNSTVDKIQDSLDATLRYLTDKSDSIPHIDLDIKNIDKEILFSLRKTVKSALNSGDDEPVGVAILDNDFSKNNVILRFSGVSKSEVSRVKKAVNNFFRDKRYNSKIKLEYML